MISFVSKSTCVDARFACKRDPFNTFLFCRPIATEPWEGIGDSEKRWELKAFETFFCAPNFKFLMFFMNELFSSCFFFKTAAFHSCL